MECRPDRPRFGSLNASQPRFDSTRVARRETREERRLAREAKEDASDGARRDARARTIGLGAQIAAKLDSYPVTRGSLSLQMSSTRRDARRSVCLSIYLLSISALT